MALLSTTLVIFFGMVISIGHLIQARMNLQNAVDLAALSGASWQARFLDQISLINYRMRQNYKFILYDLYVTQSRFNRGLQAQVLPFSGTNWDLFDRIPKDQVAFGICQQAFGYAPVSAIGETGSPTAENTDLCQLAIGAGGRGRSLPPIIPSPTPNINPVLIALNAAIAGLAQRVREICAESSGQNEAYFVYLMKHINDRQRHQVLEALNVLTTFDAAFGRGQQLESGARADETMLRTFNANLISANLSGAELSYINPSETRAFRNDGADSAAIATRIFENNPPRGSFSNYFERSRVQFQSYSVDFGAACSSEIKLLTAAQNTILGLSRSRLAQGDEVKVPFSVVLKATVQPRLLFWPRSLTPRLVAVGAAKPFGSRVGPPLELTNFEVSGVPNLRTENNTASFANMSFYPGDAGSIGDGDPNLPGVGHRRIIKYLFESLERALGPGSGENQFRPGVHRYTNSIPNCSGASGRPDFICLALAPTLYESLFWNIFLFPVDRYANQNRELISGFPIATFPEAPMRAADPRLYLMLDRMPENMAQARPQVLDLWHETMTIGQEAIFRTSDRKPAFFADRVSLMSSWSPNYQYDASDVDATGATVQDGETAGRSGYSIKLTSVRQICDEILQGNTVGLGELQSYCTDGPLEVYH